MAPDRLGDLGWLLALTSSSSDPSPAIFDGDGPSWALAPLNAAILERLRECAVATVAVVRGMMPEGRSDLFSAFDLLVCGGDLTVDARLADWTGAFERSPQAATVLARSMRDETGSLVAESLAYSVLQSGREFRRWLACRRPLHTVASGDRVALHIAEGRAEIVLTRPDRHNALDSLMREQLCDALDVVAERRVQNLTIQGEGPSFCSGGDLDEFGTAEDPLSAHFVRQGRSVAARFRALADRTVVGIHGATIGAGIELSAFAARVIAAADVSISLPEVGFGLLPGSGGTISVPRRIGRQRFLDLAISGRRIGAIEARELGLVDEVVDRGQLSARLRTASVNE